MVAGGVAGPQLATESLRQLRPVVWQRPDPGVDRDTYHRQHCRDRNCQPQAGRHAQPAAPETVDTQGQR